MNHSNYFYKWIGTFHGTFLKMLKEIYNDKTLELKYNSNFGIYDDGEAKSLVNKILKDLKLEEKLEVNPARSMISKLKNE